MYIKTRSSQFCTAFPFVCAAVDILSLVPRVEVTAAARSSIQVTSADLQQAAFVKQTCNDIQPELDFRILLKL
jgi:hypothetical protein